MKNWTHFRYGSWLDARVLILLFSFIRLRYFRRFQRKMACSFSNICFYLYYQKIHTKTQIYINHIDIHIHMYFSTYSYLYLHIYAAHTYTSYILLNQQKKHQFFGELSLRLDRPRWWFQSSNWIIKPPGLRGENLPKIFVWPPHADSWKIAKGLKGFFGCFFWWIWIMFFFLKPPPSDSCLLKAGVQSSTETTTLEKKRSSEPSGTDRSCWRSRGSCWGNKVDVTLRSFKQKLPSSIN